MSGPARLLLLSFVRFGVAVLFFGLGCGSRGDETAAPPDILLITVDTLRADFVHSYGFPEETTPQLDALAARGVLFETAVAASTATVPAHASIMTSRYVRQHSVGAENGSARLEGATTLADEFRSAGYQTAAFVSNIVLKARTGLWQGFDHYDDELPGSEANRGAHFERVANDTVSRAQTWLAQPRERPFFLWVHLQDPHGPYTPPEPWASRIDELPLRTNRELPVLHKNWGRGGIPEYQALAGVRRAGRYAGLYANEIAFADHWIGELVAAVEVAARGNGVVIAMTADHGESLDELGYFFQHGHATTPELALVPLLIVAPGVTPRRVPGVTSHVDIAPTLLELAGLAGLDNQSGISLVPALGGAPLPDRFVLSDIGPELSAYDRAGYTTVKVLRNGKLDWQRYERRRDGHGFRKRELDALAPEIVRYVREQVPTVRADTMSEEDAERLRALGYLPPAETRAAETR